jgi:CRP/FNR family transcriptional regulator, cyclic AMP receptor protein
VDWKLLGALTTDEQRIVISQTQRRRYRRAEVIFHEGDPGEALHLIAKGHVAIRNSTPLGDVVTLAVVGPGDFFGELVIVSPHGARAATAVALDPTETLTLHREQLDALRHEHPAVDRFFLEVMARQLRRTSLLLSDALYLSAGKRVLRRLLEVADTYGDAAPATLIPLTQEDLAGLAGTTRPSANKALREAQDAGLLTITRGQIRILDMDGLARRAR